MRQHQQQIIQKAHIELKMSLLLLLLLLLYIIITRLVALPVQSVACQSKQSNSAVTITANKMDANSKTIKDFVTQHSELYWRVSWVCSNQIVLFCGFSLAGGYQDDFDFR